MGFFAWLVVGLIAGWLAGLDRAGSGYAVLVNILLGIGRLSRRMDRWQAWNLVRRRKDRTGRVPRAVIGLTAQESRMGTDSTSVWLNVGVAKLDLPTK